MAEKRFAREETERKLESATVTAEYLRMLRQAIGEKRYLHTLGTVYRAEELCSLTGREDLTEKAVRAALLHDCAKELPKPALRVLCGEDTGNATGVWHAFAGAVLAKTLYGERDDEVLRAIRLHCSGDAGMTELDRIVYLADLTEPGRSFPGVERYREASERSLKEAMMLSLRDTVTRLTREGRPVHPATARALVDLERETKQEEKN